MYFLLTSPPFGLFLWMKIYNLKHVEQRTHLSPPPTPPRTPLHEWERSSTRGQRESEQQRSTWIIQQDGEREPGEGRAWRDSYFNTSQTQWGGTTQNKQTQQSRSWTNTQTLPRLINAPWKAKWRSGPGWINTAVTVGPTLMILAGSKVPAGAAAEQLRDTFPTWQTVNSNLVCLFALYELRVKLSLIDRWTVYIYKHIDT